MTDEPTDPLKDWMDKHGREISVAPSCGNCRFASKTQTVNQLACTRYPPQVVPLPPNQILTQFPIMQSRQLCGEWQPQLAS